MSEKPVVKIGFAGPLTGSQSVVAIPMLHAVEAAVAQAEGRGDLPFRLEAAAFDDGADEARAVRVAAEVCSDPAVLALVGHKNSGPNLAAGPLYEAAGLARMCPSATNTELTRLGWKGFFRLCADDAVQSQAAARAAREVIGAQRPLVVHDGTTYGLPLARQFAEVWRAAGGPWEAPLLAISPGESDYSAAVEGICQSDADLLFFALTEIESARLSRDLRAAKVSISLLGTDGGRTSKYLELAGEAGDGSFQTYAGMDPSERPEATGFLQAMGVTAAPVYAAECYDAAAMIIGALRRMRKPSRQGLQDAIAGSTHRGVTGEIRFDPQGNRVGARVSLWRVENGLSLQIADL